MRKTGKRWEGSVGGGSCRVTSGGSGAGGDLRFADGVTSGRERLAAGSGWEQTRRTAAGLGKMLSQVFTLQ